MASQRPPRPSWAPEGAEWSNKLDLQGDLSPRRGAGLHGLLVLVIVLVPILLIAGGAYYVLRDRADTYVEQHPGTLLNMPRTPSSAEVVLEGDLQHDLGLPSTVTGYATDATHVLVVATRVHHVSDPQREFDRILKEASQHATRQTAPIRYTARKPGDAEAPVPTDGGGGVGRCYGDSTGTVCLMVNKGSVLLVVEVRTQSVSEAVRRASLVRGFVLHKKPLVDLNLW